MRPFTFFQPREMEPVMAVVVLVAILGVLHTVGLIIILTNLGKFVISYFARAFDKDESDGVETIETIETTDNTPTDYDCVINIESATFSYFLEGDGERMEVPDLDEVENTLTQMEQFLDKITMMLQRNFGRVMQNTPDDETTTTNMPPGETFDNKPLQTKFGGQIEEDRLKNMDLLLNEMAQQSLAGHIHMEDSAGPVDVEAGGDGEKEGKVLFATFKMIDDQAAA